jgi:hypothetical protein
MKKKTYQIKKIMKDCDDNLQHVLLLNSLDEVFESDNLDEVIKMCEVFNKNTDRGWRYEIITILKK